MKVFAIGFLFWGGLATHWLLSTHLSVFGLSPDLLLILTAAVAARSGATAGQGYGFLAGLFLDIASGHIFGAHALLLTITGYLIGRLRRQMDVTSGPSGAVIVAVLTPIYGLLYGLLGLLFEREFLSPGWTGFLIDPFYNLIVAPFVFEIVRRMVKD